MNVQNGKYGNKNSVDVLYMEIVLAKIAILWKYTYLCIKI